MKWSKDARIYRNISLNHDENIFGNIEHAYIYTYTHTDTHIDLGRLILFV